MNLKVSIINKERDYSNNGKIVKSIMSYNNSNNNIVVNDIMTVRETANHFIQGFDKSSTSSRFISKK